MGHFVAQASPFVHRCAVKRRSKRGRSLYGRRGSATVDYFLLICIVLPLATFLMWIAPRAIQSVYDLLTVVVAWPFM